MPVETLFDQKIIRLHDLKGNSLRNLIALGRIFQDALQVASHFVDQHFKRKFRRRLFFKRDKRCADAGSGFRPLPKHGGMDTALRLGLGDEKCR
ncbi:hypothetical protein C068_01892 [Brucella sp. UK38/05]|nr:hypothetical protein C068_01892 [Brucella sp. UK38/05]ENT11840.1 hypothetical protein C001_00240 [Brucella sp. F5/06]